MSRKNERNIERNIGFANFVFRQILEYFFMCLFMQSILTEFEFIYSAESIPSKVQSFLKSCIDKKYIVFIFHNRTIEI